MYLIQQYVIKFVSDFRQVGGFILVQKNKDRATRTPLKPGVISGAEEGLVILAQVMAPVVLLLYDIRQI